MVNFVEMDLGLLETDISVTTLNSEILRLYTKRNNLLDIILRIINTRMYQKCHKINFRGIKIQITHIKSFIRCNVAVIPYLMMSRYLQKGQKTCCANSKMFVYRLMFDII